MSLFLFHNKRPVKLTEDIHKIFPFVTSLVPFANVKKQELQLENWLYWLVTNMLLSGYDGEVATRR